MYNEEMMHPYDSFSRHLAKTFLWMVLGMCASALTAWVVADSGLWAKILVSFFGYGSLILLIAQLALVVMLSKAVRSWSMSATVLIFMGYAVLTGVNLSVLPMVYDVTSIYLALGFAAVMFGCMAVIGLTTRVDLSRFAPLFVCGLFALILVSLVGLFMDLSGAEMMINVAAVALFLGITAWDMQKIRGWYQSAVMDENAELLSKLTILGALELYLDFVNLFLKLLRVMNRRRK